MGTAAFSVDSATKAAVRNFARSWILDLAGRHIRINTISPGPTATPGLEGLAETEERARQFKATMVANIPLGRLGTSDEVAKAVVFLASDDSSSSTGPNSSSTAASRRFKRLRSLTAITRDDGTSTRWRRRSREIADRVSGNWEASHSVLVSVPITTPSLDRR
jgi:short-subunit dehydrogenase